MSHLKIFLNFVQDLSVKPFSFWSQKKQVKELDSVALSITNLKGILEEKVLTETKGYRTLINLEKILHDKPFDEIEFVERFRNLLDIYKLSNDGRHKKTLESLDQVTREATNLLLEYHISLEMLGKNGRNMDDKQKNNRDMETMQKVGVFYVLEYTVYLLWLIPQLKQSDIEKLFFEGLKTKDANLPPYDQFRKSFLTSLCYKIFDDNLRNDLLIVFYEFEETYNTKNIVKILPAFKAFNLKLLEILKKIGIKNFKTVLLSPFGKNIPIDALISKINEIKIQ